MVILTMVVAGSTALFTYYAKKQFIAMNGQLAEMRSASGQTDRLIGLYQQQLSELHEQATDIHELAAQAKNQADRTKDVADRALVQAIATNKLAEQAKRSADISEMSSEAVDRPILGLEEPPRLLKEIQTVRLTFKNYGAAEVSDAAFESIVSSNDK